MVSALDLLGFGIYLRRINNLIYTTMIKKFFAAIERIEVLATNHPFMFQQILESYDELFWLVNAIIDSFR